MFKKAGIFILIACCYVKAFSQTISRNEYWQNLTADSLSLIVRGHIAENKTGEDMPFVKVKWFLYETESDVNGNYKLKIPLYLLQQSKSDTVSINYHFECYCFPARTVKVKQLNQTVSIEGKRCCIELKANPPVQESKPLIEK